MCIYTYILTHICTCIYVYIDTRCTHVYILRIKLGSIGIIAIEGNKVDRCSTPYLGELLFKVLR